MQTKNIILAFFLFMLFTQTSSAQNTNVTIKGTVTDSISKETIPYATLKIMSPEDQLKPLKAVVTDDKGKFSFPMTTKGKYILQIEYIGKEIAKHTFDVGDEKTINLGTILMNENTQTLNEVVIAAQKPLVKVEMDKITYSMQDDPEAKTNNLLEMLKKVPMITVDGEENIQLKGSSSFKIYMNGKPSNMISSNPKEILRSMPANNIKDIEVITDPGAKYDAEGVAGILNIITHSNSSMGGYTATLTGRADEFGGFGGGVNFSLKYGKFGFMGNYNYGRYKAPGGEAHSYRETFNDVANKYLYNDGRSKYRNNNQFGSGELSYEIDTLNLINVGFSRFYGDGKNYSDVRTRMLNEQEVSQYEYDRNGESKYNYGGTDVNVDYQRTFNKKEQLLTTSYRFSTSPNDSESMSMVENAQGTLPTWIYSNQQFSDASMKEHTVQIDFVAPFGKKHSIETGVKYIIRLNESTNGYEILNNGAWIPDPIYVDNPNTKFKHRQDIFSAYGGYNFKLNKLGFKAGLRYESTQMEAKYKIDPKRDFKSDYSNLVPSTTVSYQLTQTQNLRLGYNMRIYRPSIWQLNPYEDTSNPNAIRQGNAELDAVKSHSINLNYGLFTPKFNMNFNLAYSFSNNEIESISSMIGNGISYTTYKNIGKNKRIGGYGYFNWSITQKLRLYSNLGGDYVDRKANNETGLSNHGFSGNVSGGLQYTLPYTINFNGNYGYYSPWIGLESKGSSFTYHNLSLNKNFIKDRLNIRINASNLFTKNREHKWEQTTPTFYSLSRNDQRMRSFSIAVSYRFGEMKSQIKKATRGITNDDSMGGGGGQGGSQGGGGQ